MVHADRAIRQFRKRLASIIAVKGRVQKNLGFLKKPNLVGFLGFIGIFGQAGKHR